MPLARPEVDTLSLDAYTLRDLEIFTSETGGISLFQFCNLTRTDGGARVLRRRMETPFATPEAIDSTQRAIAFIVSQREVFGAMPSAYAVGRVEHYTHEILPLVTQRNWFEFGMGAFSLWHNHDLHYLNIVRGVQFTCAMIRVLHNFVEQEVLASAPGDLVPMIDEMRALLDKDEFRRIPTQQARTWPWQILRLDQLFRLYESETISRLLNLVFEIDALVAMADVTRNHDFVFPDIESGPMRIEAEGVFHPFVHEAVANPVSLDQEHRVLFLTGPNMAGKTTYLRAFATAYYLAHLGMGVPAVKFRFVPAERLFSSISLNDNLRDGVSYFRAEALRVKAIAQAIAEGFRVVAIMDEPFKGTNVKDAFDASLAILERFAEREGCLFMFSSHLIELSEQVSNARHIDCRYFEAEEGEGRLRFDYRLQSGISSQRLGMRVLREEGVFDLLDQSAE